MIKKANVLMQYLPHIRSLFEAGKTQKEIAKIYNVSATTMGMFLHDNGYRHIPGWEKLIGLLSEIQEDFDSHVDIKDIAIKYGANRYDIQRLREKGLVVKPDIPNGMKLCKGCRRVLNKTGFYSSPNRSTGLYNWCKDCTREYRQIPEVKERRNEADRKRRQETVDYYKKGWLYEKQRMDISMDYRVKRKMHKFIHNALWSNGTLNRDMFSYSTGELRAHLESRFDENMDWENYGTYWHIDHKIPVSWWDGTSKQEMKQCWALTNLQPLPAFENISKGNRVAS